MKRNPTVSTTARHRSDGADEVLVRYARRRTGDHSGNVEVASLRLAGGAREKIDLDHVVVRCGLLAERQPDGKHEKRRDLIGRQRIQRSIADVEACKRICVLDFDLEAVTEKLGEAGGA